MAYLTGAEIAERLTDRFPALPAVTVGDGDAEIASAEFDGLAPFVGIRQESDQENAFPRSVNPDGTTNESTDAPDVVLDLVCLFAHRTTAEEEKVAITSRSRSGLSQSYSRPMRPRVERLIDSRLAALQGFLRKTGRTSSVTYPVPYIGCYEPL